MKLLIVTQKVDENDAILGFFHGWIAEFAKYCVNIVVICLEEGVHHLPENVKVLSLGKERRHSRLQYLARFYRYIWQERRNYQAVFVHMNPEYVVLGGMLWWFFGKKNVLWYTHKSVDLKLRIAEKVVDKIFTASRESFRLPSKKVLALGHGIDLERFAYAQTWLWKDFFKIVTVGRISPVKDYETLINAISVLAKKKIPLRVAIIGDAPTQEHREYFKLIKEKIQNEQLEDMIVFYGSARNFEVVRHLQSANLFVSMSHTGSMDKAVLEAMACGLPVVTCNEAFFDVLQKYKDLALFQKGDSNDLAQKIQRMIGSSQEQKKEMGDSLRHYVATNHNLAFLIKKILAYIKD